MKRQRRAFTLVELLLGAFLASVLGMMMLSWEGESLRVFNRSSAWLLAHERGQRVLAFLETKVLHTGLGLSACRDEEACWRAFGMEKGPSVPRSLSVYLEKSNRMSPAKEENGVFRGIMFAFLYGRPSGLLVKRAETSPAEPGGKVEFRLLSDDVANKITQVGFQIGNMKDVTNWCALPLAGMPFYIDSASGRSLFLSLATTAEASVDIPPVNELYLLQYEQFRVVNGKLYFRKWEAAWSPYYPREEGVLALWVEWRPGIRVLDLWVLTTGGPAPLGGAARPLEWPEDAPWQNDFTQHTLCVSRASWRLENG